MAAEIHGAGFGPKIRKPLTAEDTRGGDRRIARFHWLPRFDIHHEWGGATLKRVEKADVIALVKKDLVESKGVGKSRGISLRSMEGGEWVSHGCHVRPGTMEALYSKEKTANREGKKVRKRPAKFNQNFDRPQKSQEKERKQ